MTTIEIRGARQHNLKGIDLDLPSDELIVVTGPSGSGKSSLVLDTISAEGRRRYLECLALEGHAQLRGWPQPEVDSIRGLPPTLAIHEPTRGLHETVATRTDLYELLALLYSHACTFHSPATGEPLYRYSPNEMVVEILKRLPAGSRYQLMAPVQEEPRGAVERMRQQGFVRYRWNGEEFDTERLPEGEGKLELVVDRLIAKPELTGRLQDSLRTALTWGHGAVRVLDAEARTFDLAEHYMDPHSGERYQPLAPADFYFWSVRGRCPICLGTGRSPPSQPQDLIGSQQALGHEMDQLIQTLPTRRRSLHRALWQALVEELHIDPTATISALDPAARDILFWGRRQPLNVRLTMEGKSRLWRGPWHGLASWIPYLTPRGSSKESWPLCRACGGSGLNSNALGCRIHGLTLPQLLALSVAEALKILQGWAFHGVVAQLAGPTIAVLKRRLQWMSQLGLYYLQLNRPHDTLSMGEAQRLHLAGQLGGRLSGILYCLDEPSSGLHPKDLQGLVQSLHQLKAEGNGILVVEHNEELIRAADRLIELGPGGGSLGGNLMFQGTLKELLRNKQSPTSAWLRTRRETLDDPLRRPSDWISLKHLNLHNLQNIDVDIPLGVFCGLCGVSGSGKSTLALEALGYPLLKKQRPIWMAEAPELRVVLLEQRQSGVAEQSLAASVMGLMEPLQKAFANTRTAKAHGYSASFFSLHRKGGRCEGCNGRGTIRFNFPLIEPIEAICDVCQGKRYSYEALQITYQGHTIADLLALTAQEASSIITAPEIVAKLQLMQSLGLGYLTLGQRASTLSAGERQRLRLVAELSESHHPTLYILDEPSRGLHATDVTHLIAIFRQLTASGHTILAVEHNLDLLRSADWLLELGPGGGPDGGQLLFQGPPAQMRGRPTPTGQVI